MTSTEFDVDFMTPGEIQHNESLQEVRGPIRTYLARRMTELDAKSNRAQRHRPEVLAVP